MTDHDKDWWEARCRKRYREVQRLEAIIAAVRAAVASHDDCWPDDWRAEIARDVRTALAEPARVMPTVPHPTPDDFQEQP